MKTTTKTQRKRRTAPVGKACGPANAWLTHHAGGLEILRAAALAKLPWVVHGFSTRPGGASSLNGQRVLNLGHTDWDAQENVLANRTRFVAALNPGEMKLVTLHQTHTAIIHQLCAAPEETPRGDAAVTNAPGLLLGVQTADCIPILLADSKRRAVAAIHAGWRGTLARIAQKVLGRMQMLFETDPSDIVAVIGPGIGACCYEVGLEVAQAYAGQFECAAEWFNEAFRQLASGEEPNPLPWLSQATPGHEPPAPRTRLNLPAANCWQLLDAGVLLENITTSKLCTACRTDLLFSHRRESGRTGRLMSVIGLRAE